MPSSIRFGSLAGGASSIALALAGSGLGARENLADTKPSNVLSPW